MSSQLPSSSEEMNNDKQEYVLDKDTIDSDYSEGNIKQSFAVKPEEYEEEDI